MHSLKYEQHCVSIVNYMFLFLFFCTDNVNLRYRYLPSRNSHSMTFERTMYVHLHKSEITRINGSLAVKLLLELRYLLKFDEVRNRTTMKQNVFYTYITNVIQVS